MLAEIDGAIGWMTFDKPARRDAVSPDMGEAMPVILGRFEWARRFGNGASGVKQLRDLAGPSFAREIVFTA
jgi:hypothetical protein